MRIVIFLIGVLSIPMLHALTVEMVRAHDVVPCDIDTSRYVIDKSMWKHVVQDKRTTNERGKKRYSFQHAKINSYYLCGDDRYPTWKIIDSRGQAACLFKIIIFPNRYEALRIAVSQYPLAETQFMTEKNVSVESMDGYTLLRLKSRNKHGAQAVLSVEKNGILLYDIIWRKTASLITCEEQKRLVMKVIDLVSSNEPQKAYTQELQALLNRKEEEQRLRLSPGYGMARSVEESYRKYRLFPTLPEGDRTFKHPRLMWNRPSLSWFGQFRKAMTSDMKKEWNERGDIIGFDFPNGRGKEGYRCGITIAHAISEYEALRFMEGFALGSDLPYGDDEEQERRIRKFNVNAGFVGEHSLMLKPQLDATGALVPNVEESRICFVRNNTAVRVVADRPDVSVLWIARKIDEELIAAGKGEPPTWTPRKVPAPVPAAGSK